MPGGPLSLYYDSPIGCAGMPCGCASSAVFTPALPSVNAFRAHPCMPGCNGLARGWREATVLRWLALLPRPPCSPSVSDARPSPGEPFGAPCQDNQITPVRACRCTRRHGVPSAASLQRRQCIEVPFLPSELVARDQSRRPCSSPPARGPLRAPWCAVTACACRAAPAPKARAGRPCSR